MFVGKQDFLQGEKAVLYTEAKEVVVCEARSYLFSYIRNSLPNIRLETRTRFPLPSPSGDAGVAEKGRFGKNSEREDEGRKRINLFLDGACWRGGFDESVLLGV